MENNETDLTMKYINANPKTINDKVKNARFLGEKTPYYTIKTYIA